MWGWEREQKRRKVGLDLPKPLLTMDGEGWEHWKCRRAHHAAGYFFLKHFLLFCMRWREGGAAVRWRPSIRYACATLLNYITLYYANFFFFDIFSLFRRFFEGPFLKVPFSPLKCPKKKTGNKYETQRWGGGAYLFVEQFVVKYFTLRALEGFQIQY